MTNQFKTGTAATQLGARNLTEDFVTFTIAGQYFGISVLKVRDVLSSYQITPMPLAPPEIVGSLNLRGRVVTAIDLRLRIGLPPRPAGAESMSVVAENDGELYSLVVDTVGEVLALSTADYQRNPPTLDPKFRAYSDGIFRLNDQLLVVLDVNRLLSYGQMEVA